jgi:acid phosphatase
MTNTNGSGWRFGALGVAAGLVVGYLVGQGPSPNPQQRGLDANLWMQTAGEYRACCLQTYRQAWERLQQKVKKAAPAKGKPLAVIMDLDETVLDNSGFQTSLSRDSVDYSDSLWDEWEKDHFDEVRLVPGAREFIEKAEGAGVAVVYLSNRAEKNRAGTIAALEHVKLDTRKIENRLLLAGSTSDKTERRNQVRKRYEVLMLFGDNLRDFDEKPFKAKKVGEYDVSGQNEAIAERLKQVDEQRSHWGDDWIILPNPVYGEWTKLLGRRSLDNMRPRGRSR